MPPVQYQASPPDDIAGVWRVEHSSTDERIRVARYGEHALYLDFPAESAAADNQQKSLLAETVRFDQQDWLVVDLRRFNEKTPPSAPFMMIRYALKSRDRLCASLPPFEPFVAAIRAGELAGTLSPRSGVSAAGLGIEVSASGEEWVTWWQSLPITQKGEDNGICFDRVPSRVQTVR